MKKFSFLMGALLVASAGLFTSCFCDDDDNAEPEPVVIVDETDLYSFIYSSNVPATFEVVGETVEGNTVTIIATATDGKDYIGGNTMEKEITLGDTRIVDVHFEFEEAPETVQVPEDEDVTIYMGDGTSTLDESAAFMKEIASVKTGAQVYIPADGVENAFEEGAENDFSIEIVLNTDTIKQVSAEKMQEVQAQTANNPLETETVSFVCKPDGADFGEDYATLTILTENAEGVDFYAVYEDENNPTDTPERVDGVSSEGKHEIKVPHFSNWNIILKAKVQNYKKTSSKVEKTQDINAGSNKIKYTSTKGWTNDRPNTLVNAYLQAKLGQADAVKSECTMTYSSSRDATVYYTITTSTVEFDIVSGTSEPYHVTVDLGSKVTITKVVPRTTPIHSGGSAN